MRTHRKLTSYERDKIAYWYAVGERIREIARRLGRSPSSISEEVKRSELPVLLMTGDSGLVWSHELRAMGVCDILKRLIPFRQVTTAYGACRTAELLHVALTGARGISLILKKPLRSRDIAESLARHHLHRSV